MATQTGSIDLTASIEARNDARKYADNYIRQDSTGIRIADANPDTATTYQHQTATNTEFVVEGVSKMKLSGDGQRIGKEYVEGATDNESHMELDYHSLQMVDKNGYSFVHFSDLRDTTGHATLTARYVGDGTTTSFSTSPSNTVTSETVVTVDGNVVTDVTITRFSVTFATAPQRGSVITIQYRSDSSDAKAFTLGRRYEGSNLGPYSVAVGDQGRAQGRVSFSANRGYADGYLSSAFGASQAQGSGSHAEGEATANGDLSHAEGTYYTTADGRWSHSEGFSSASGVMSHAEGGYLINGELPNARTHPQYLNAASGDFSHAEGTLAKATGESSHAEGYFCTASGVRSHAQNLATISASPNQTALGKYNVEDANSTYALIVGNGTGDGARSNAFALDWDGCGEFADEVVATGFNGTKTESTGVLASSNNQTALGKYNVSDANDAYALIIGNGTGDNARSNAAVIDWLGNYIAQGWAGVIQMFAGSTPPAGWLLCDGSAVSRTEYATLYAAIGDTWGAGDGSTTFNLPDLRGRAPIGAGAGSGLTARTLGGTVGVESVTLNAAQSGLRAHTHSIQSVLETSGVTIASSRAATTTSGGYTYGMRKTNNNIAGVTATGAVTGGAADATSAHDNMQPSAVVNFIIHTGKTS